MQSTEMSGVADNCAVIAIAEITGGTPEKIVAGIMSYPAADGGPAFVGGVARLWSVGAYLEDRGWRVLLGLDRPAIPWTCVVATQNPDHCFAIIDGLIKDRASCTYDDAEIVFAFVPPPPGAV